MNFRFVTEIFYLLDSSTPTCKAYLLWVLEQHHYHHRNKFWALGFSFFYLLNQISRYDCKFALKKKCGIVNGLSKICEVMKFEYWAIQFYLFFIDSSWMVYFILLLGLVIFWSIRNINGKSEVLLSIEFLVAGSKGVDKLLIWEFKFKNCDRVVWRCIIPLPKRNHWSAKLSIEFWVLEGRSGGLKLVWVFFLVALISIHLL